MQASVSRSATPGLEGRLKAILNAPKRREHLVTTERQSKGDLMLRQNTANGVVVRAQQIDNTVLAHLVQIQKLEAYHAYYGLGFCELKHAFMAPMRFKSNSIYLAQIFGSAVGTNYAAEMYEHVYKKIGRKREEAVLYSCGTVWSEQVLRLFSMERIKDSFEMLLETMDTVRKDMQAD